MNNTNKVLYAIFLVLILLPFFILGCRNSKLEKFSKNLNNTATYLSDVVISFNNPSYDYEKFLKENLSEFKEKFSLVEGSYHKSYEMFIDNNLEIGRKAESFFNDNYVSAYHQLKGAFSNLSGDNFSVINFRKHYTEYGKSINNFIIVHNKFIKIMQD